MVLVEILQIDFFSEYLSVEFDAVCDLCGRSTNNTVLVEELTKLVVGCFNCEYDTCPSYIKPLYDAIIYAVTDCWGCPPEDIVTIEERLHKFLTPQGV